MRRAGNEGGGFRNVGSCPKSVRPESLRHLDRPHAPWLGCVCLKFRTNLIAQDTANTASIYGGRSAERIPPTVWNECSVFVGRRARNREPCGEIRAGLESPKIAFAAAKVCTGTRRIESVYPIKTSLWPCSRALLPEHGPRTRRTESIASWVPGSWAHASVESRTRVLLGRCDQIDRPDILHIDDSFEAHPLIALARHAMRWRVPHGSTS